MGKIQNTVNQALAMGALISAPSAKENIDESKAIKASESRLSALKEFAEQQDDERVPVMESDTPGEAYEKGIRNQRETLGREIPTAEEKVDNLKELARIKPQKYYKSYLDEQSKLRGMEADVKMYDKSLQEYQKQKSRDQKQQALQQKKAIDLNAQLAFSGITRENPQYEQIVEKYKQALEDSQ